MCMCRDRKWSQSVSLEPKIPFTSSPDALPRITIIMPVKNAAGTVAEAIASFTSQSWPHKELVVIDGLSVDGTAEIIALAASPDVRIESHADKSATEALMRGSALAGGDIIGFLMADDWLEPDALARVGEQFAKYPEVEIICGGVRIVDETTDKTPAPSVTIAGAALGLSIDSILGTPYPAAYFFRMDIWRALKGFALDYRYGADRDLLMRCRVICSRIGIINTPVYVYRKHSGSDTLVEKDLVVRSFLADHLAMASRWLRHPRLSPQDARAISAWRRAQAVELTARELRGRRLIAAIKLAVTQVIADPLLVMTAIGRLQSMVGEKLTRHVPRSQKPD